MSKAHATPAHIKVGIAFVIGLLVSVAVAKLGGWQLAPLALWDTAALVYGVWTWVNIWPMDAASTARHANREDPSRVWTDAILILASLASLVAVGVVLFGASNAAGAAKLGLAAVSIASVVLSWALVHTVFALKYAEIYYAKPEGGVDFNSAEAPSYSDFAYLAITIGMTFQVSDTAFKARLFRKTALKHALLAYLFGTVIVATTINLVAGLNK